MAVITLLLYTAADFIADSSVCLLNSIPVNAVTYCFIYSIGCCFGLFIGLGTLKLPGFLPWKKYGIAPLRSIYLGFPI